MTLYQQKANQIITEAIKSAVFIDEKALSFYDPKSKDEIIEEQLSIDLFQNFKENGVSLAVHKFVASDVADVRIKNYLFEDRDLVLLDWKLDGDAGEDYSLQLLVDIVERPHIHFCAIYTSIENFDQIFNNIISFFSGKTDAEYSQIVDSLSAYEDNLRPILDKVSIDNVNLNKTKNLRQELGAIDRELSSQLKEITKVSDIGLALKYIKIAFDFNNEFLKSHTSNKISDIVDRENKVVVINNTIITILQKNKEQDKDTKKLIERLSLQIADSNYSFTQLLGLEMQNIFSKKGAFIDSNLLKVSKQTVAYHRKKLYEDSESDLIFTEMIKTVLIEHANLNLSGENLSILAPDLLDEIVENEPPSDEELIAMNVFYNSLVLKSDKKLNFGDVFKDNDENFYLCITALCDCYEPNKIKNIYFFAVGTKIQLSDALKLGDSGFISFLPTNEAVVWSNIDNDPADGNFKKFKYMPVYIKPVSYHVRNPDFNDNAIEVRRIFEHKTIGEEIEFIPIQYLTTIKPNYTQRIANHAFAHPVRVGVDFVKKK